MASPNISAAIERYIDVATRYNEALVSALVNHVRETYLPPPATIEELDDTDHFDASQGMREEGFTLEGGIARRVFDIADTNRLMAGNRNTEFSSAMPSDAEKAGQVLARRLESVIDDMSDMVGRPYTEAEVKECHAALESKFVKELERVGQSHQRPIPMPEEWFRFLQVTRKLKGPGFPSHTDWRKVLTDFWMLHSQAELPGWDLRYWSKSAGLESILEFQIGRRENSRSDVWYTYSRPEGSQHEDYTWQIVRRCHVDTWVYGSLCEYLDCVSAETEQELKNQSEWSDRWKLSFW